MSDLYIPTTADQLWEYMIRSQIHECGYLETELYNSGLEITRPHSFISGIHKSEPDIYIGFLPALHFIAVHLPSPLHAPLSSELIQVFNSLF